MKMKKFINNPTDLTKELLEGLALANPETLEYVDHKFIVNKHLENANRVTVVTLGGTGHEPAISGFVGEGMVDISVPGDIFAAPSPQACFEAIKMADKGKGVLFVVLNHAGDMLAGNIAMKNAKKENLNVIKVITQEDVSNATRENAHDRRGLVGCIPLYKIAGGAAAMGKPLDVVAQIAQYFADNMATIAVAARGATHPATGEPIAELNDDEMEIGMGQHGEGGGGRMPLKSADETTEIMLDALLKDLNIKSGEELLVVVNGTGSTTLMEQLIIFRKVHKSLAEKNIKIVANIVGETLTVQEQAGFQLMIARMNKELLEYWNMPCNTPYFKKIKSKGGDL
ncbi:dihydroxyacetone kinase subunit DhaK [Cetobacterium sp.]|uniref:dihydroxyacetone kinase subunit DhaK n=1 Tax=Cetobacterium sp. TaxID=2071632 RepID=UPI002FC7B5F6